MTTFYSVPAARLSMQIQPMEDLVPGTREMLILRTLLRGPVHGDGIGQRIQNASNDVLAVEEGPLYPPLQRPLRKGWVTAAWGTTGLNRRARFYTITRDGRQQLGEEVSAFKRVTRALERVLGEG
jgi:PadR family transcriptional regulator PadR